MQSPKRQAEDQGRATCARHQGARAQGACPCAAVAPRAWGAGSACLGRRPRCFLTRAAGKQASGACLCASCRHRSSAWGDPAWLQLWGFQGRDDGKCDLSPDVQLCMSHRTSGQVAVPRTGVFPAICVRVFPERGSAHPRSLFRLVQNPAPWSSSRRGVPGAP